MIGLAVIVLPFLAAAALQWLPLHRFATAASAGLMLLLACALPWSGDDALEWLLLDPLAVHVTILTGFAWLLGSAADALEGLAPIPLAGVMVGCLNLALLADSAVLTVLAGCMAGLAAIMASDSPARVLPLSASGLGLALFGVAALALATSPALGEGWAAQSWSGLAILGARGTAALLGMGALFTALGLGCAVLLGPIRAAVEGRFLSRMHTVLAAPMVGVWLVVVLRLRGVLDGNGHALAPGGLLLGAGLGLVVLAIACLRVRPGSLVAAAILAMAGTVLGAFGVGGAAATAAGLLDFTLCCLALSPATTRSLPAVLGMAALIGMPPLGVFAAAFPLLAEAAAHGWLLLVVMAGAWLCFLLAALPQLPLALPSGPAERVGWVGLAVTVAATWAMPAGIAAWLTDIAAAAR